MTVGERIKEAREIKSITQTELAKVCGISKQSLYKYENNIITNIPSDKIEIISKYLSVSPAYLMGWTDMVMERKIQQPITKDNKFQQLIDNYNKLNEEGQEKLLDYSDDLVSSQKYIKNNQYVVGREA